jgi:type I restriction enzyme M protein
LIFLRHAESCFADAEKRIGKVGSGDRSKVGKEDFQAEGVIFKPEKFSQRMLQGGIFTTIGRTIASDSNSI